MRVVQLPAEVRTTRRARRRPRVGLVLGAGGVTGIAWLAGALEALREHTGWDPATADVMSGTSAGAVVATVLASGAQPHELVRFAEDRPALDAAVRAATGARPWRLADLVPRGLRSTDEIRGLTHRAATAGWPSHTKLLVHAYDPLRGSRVTFGGAEAPPAELADAVTASAAVPGWYAPVRIGGRTYVDGGVWSFTNADALAGEDLDAVVCLAPFSSPERASRLDAAVFGVARSVAYGALRRETERLRRAGKRVAVIEPSAGDLRAMGLNPMDRRRSREVIETAVGSVGPRLGRALRDVVLPREHGPAIRLAA